MNRLEQNKKIATKTTIKNSEFDRLNTTHIQDLHGSNHGIPIIPLDFEKQKNSNLLDSLLKLIGALISIFLFLTIPSLLEPFLNKTFYNSLKFLAFSLLACLLVGCLFYYLCHFYFIRRKKG